MIPLVTPVLLAHALAGAPSITLVQPTPLPHGALAEVTGGGFVAGTTGVAIGGVEQALVLEEPATLRFFVAQATPLGTQALVVTVGAERAEVTVEVAPPLPSIGAVAPDPLVVGGRVTVSGERLDAVTAVTLSEWSCAIVEQSQAELACDLPFDHRLLGRGRLELASASGVVARDVDVVAPAPEIIALTPSPARAGELVEVRGRILPLAPEVRIGGEAAPAIALATEGDTTIVTVWVPSATAPGAHELTVRAAGVTSSAASLVVQAPSPFSPEVHAVHPGRVAAGGAFYVVGANLDRVTSATAGLVIEGCDERVCRLTSAGLPAGPPLLGAVTGPYGAATFEVELVDEPPKEARILSVEPLPARRGEPLTIVADGVAAVRSVLIGGVTQVVESFDGERIVVIVAPTTSLGAGQLYLLSNVGSDGFTISVLDPAPEPGPEAMPDDEAEVERAVVERELTASDDGGGCASGSTPYALLAAFVALTWRRRASRGSCRTRP